jgi:hypothetical protein
MLRKIVLVVLAAGLTVVGTGAEAASHLSVSAKPTPAQTAAVKQAEGADFANTPPFLVGQAYLNADRHGVRRPDLIIMSVNQYNCGTGGCGVTALLATANGYAAKEIDLVIISRDGEFTVLDAVHHGMHDLRASNGGVFRWDGTQYR